MSSKYSSRRELEHDDEYRRDKERSRDRKKDFNRKRSPTNKSEYSVRHKSRSRSSEYDRKKSSHNSKRERSNDRDKKKHKSKERNHTHKEDMKSSHKKKSKKKHKDSSSSSSDSSESSSDSEKELKLLKRLEDERLKQLAERKKMKELMKANETPEEKRARRLREKREKERKRREKMGWDGEYQHYTNQDNPFGDAELTQTFVWTKKLTQDGLDRASRDEIDARNRQKQFDNKIELEKVKKRRIEREAEREAREDEALALQRGREAAQWRHWQTLEDAFHLQQARLRTRIRIQDGRAKAIDLLAWYVSAEGEVDAVEMHEPYTYLNGLQIPDLEDLLEDIKVYKELEKDANLSYWTDITTIVQDELEKLRAAEGEGGGGRRDGIHHAVAQDVTQVFKGKTGPQLEALQQQIESKIQGRHDGVDVGYWESLLSQLKAHMARARLRDRHQQNLRRKLEMLKQEQGVAEGPKATEDEEQAGPSTRTDEAGPSGSTNNTVSATAEVKTEEEEEKKDEESDEEWSPHETDMTSEYLKMYLSGRYSPTLVESVEPGTLIMEPDHDQQRIEFLRSKVLNTETKETEEPTNPTVLALEREARRDMGGDEVRFSVEAPLPDQLYLWSDKYRPRKPRYFNRVHTGFEWNKYNQTHYDMDNPPPKIVQGYKFNIFYPDLIDKNSTPQFSLKPCPDNPDFGVLRFHAGPPYEDIAFKIVNREWEYSYKRGFRCQFQNNIFQLWFHFKRYRYRR